SRHRPAASGGDARSPLLTAVTTQGPKGCTNLERPALPRSFGGHARFQFLEPVEHDLDLPDCCSSRQRKQTQPFLQSDRFLSRLALRFLPFLVRTELVRPLVGKRLWYLQHGVVPVRLTA